MVRKLSILMMLTTVILSGCLYPEDRLAKNQVPNNVQLQSMQAAIDEYIKQNPMRLPIKTRDEDTPIFRKYPIDFSILKEARVVSEAPGNSYERGGVYQYVIIHPEKDPEVKVIDLRTINELRKVSVRIMAYRSENRYPPYGKKIANDVYTIDYDKIGLKDQAYVKSPYSGNNLPIVMGVNGDVYIDYRPDLYEALNKYEHDYKPGDDIRFLLAEHSAIVPAQSMPYTIKDGEPVFNINAD